MTWRILSRLIPVVALTAWILLSASTAFAGEANSRPDCRSALAANDNPAAARRAIRACNLELGNGELSAQRRAELLVHRATAYGYAQEGERAAADLVAARAMSPADPWLARMIGETYVQLGRFADAERELAGAIELEPHPAAFQARCAVRMETKRYLEALADCETAHSADPSSRSAVLTAQIYRELGRHASAMALLENAVASRYSDAATLRLLSSLYDEAGRSADALRITAMRRRAPAPR